MFENYDSRERETMTQKIPSFKFCLREDLQENKEFLPTRGEPKATGWDVRVASKEDIVLQPFQKVLIPLGFRAFCPDGWWFELKPRSSTFAKKHLHSLYGTIDEGYEGYLVFACQYIPELEFYSDYTYIADGHSSEDKKIRYLNCDNINTTLTLKFGEAIGQIIPVQRQEMNVEEVSTKEYENLCSKRNGVRGIGGFGSTDHSKI